MDTRALGRTVWALSLPLLFLEVGDALVHVTDTAFLARIGTAELGGIALGDTALELLVFPVVGLLEALQLVIARRAGQNREADIGTVFARGFWVALAASVALAAVVWLGAGTISGWLAESARVVEPLERFLEIAALGIPFEAMNLAYGALYVGLLRPRVLMWATVVLVLGNLVLGYVLILGNFGAPRLGMEGAALSFVGAEAATFVLLTVYTLWDPELRVFGLFRLRRVEESVLRPLVRLSAPVSLQELVGDARWFIFFIVVERVSDDILAWSNVIFACYLVLMMPSYAFSEAAYTMVSNVIGGGHPERLEGVVRRTTMATFAVSAPLVAFAVAFPGAALWIFSTEAGPIAGADTALRVVAVAMLVVIPAQLWMAAVLGSGDVDAALLIELAFSVVIVLGAVAAAVFGIAIGALWLSLPAAAAVALALSYARLRTGRWRERVV